MMFRILGLETMLLKALAGALVPDMLTRLETIRLNPRLIFLPEGPGDESLRTALLQQYPDAVCDRAAAGKQADLFVAGLVLPWLDDPDAFLHSAASCLYPGGVLLLSAFGPDTFRELPASCPAGAKLYDMHDVGDALARAGFSGPVLDVEEMVLAYRDEKKMRAEINASGMLAAELKRGAVSRDETGRYLLTLEIIFAHAFRGTEKKVSDEVRVPVSAIVRRGVA